MNKRAREVWSAWFEGEKVQTLLAHERFCVWQDANPKDYSLRNQPHNNPTMWRVKPTQPTQLRFALMQTLDRKMSYVLFCRSGWQEDTVERTPEFVKWMTKGVETDLPEIEIEQALRQQPMRHDSHCIDPKWAAIKNQQEQQEMNMHTATNDHHILEAMDRFGGSFTRHLAATARAADMANYQRLRRTFIDFWERFEELSDAMVVAEDHRPGEPVREVCTPDRTD